MRTRLMIVLCIFFVVLAGCAAAQNLENPDVKTPESEPVSKAEIIESDLFPLSSECISCHDDINAEGGVHYSFVEDWFNSIHGQSAVDPLFMAVARRETLLLPEASDDIQAICASCHLPMADMAAIVYDKPRSFLDHASQPDNELHQLYLDGISCMFCHQVSAVHTDGNTAFRESDLSINLHQAPAGETRYLFGYHESSETAQLPMLNALGYSTRASSVGRNEIICTTCHTLYTDSHTVEGLPTGRQLPEQVVPIEWKDSGWNTQSCQFCHMPLETASGPLSNNVAVEGASQGKIASHIFVSSNVYLFQLNNSNKSLDKGIAAYTEFLQSKTVRMLLANGDLEPTDSGTLLSMRVIIDSEVGHKFPSGFPSRRAWIHFQVVDDSGKLLFESGGYDDQGMIYDNDADITKGAFEPHYTIINQPGQVQIYESIMLDSNGQATTNLLQGVTYGKDNRLLPLGTNKAILQGDAMVVGEAFDDADFIGGRDIVRYQINLPAGTSNVTVKVELLYQSVGYRFMDDLMSDLSTEQQTLAKLIEQHPNLPVVVTSKEMSITR